MAGTYIQFCCKRCGHRMFDYIKGNFSLEIKCKKCKRVVLINHLVYHRLIKNTKEDRIEI